MNSDENDTRRHHPRLPHVAGVRIRLLGPEGPTDENPIYASMVDVSPEGAHLLAAYGIETGRSVEMELHEAMLGEPVNIRGIVRWCQGDAEDEIYSLGVKIHVDDLPSWEEVIVQAV